jgi:RNA polymerase sigma factor (sigma-70 family)
MPSVRHAKDAYTTRSTLLLRLNTSDPLPREVAWREFRDRYAPIIAGFARNLGSRPQDVDDLIQEVLTGFYAASPTFVYDPTKGRFRGYLKTCTLRALQDRRRQDVKFNGVPIADVDPAAPDVERSWNEGWEQELLRRALEQLRRERGERRSFQAFERNVILGRSATEVAAELKMPVNSVHKAKAKMLPALQEKLRAMRQSWG